MPSQPSIKLLVVLLLFLLFPAQILAEELPAGSKVKTEIKTYYIHQDHLGGTSVVTDENGDIVQTLDYYPYGDTRIDEQTEGFDSSKKFTGQEEDPESGLYYFNARYYDPSIGKFIGQDPVARDNPERLLKDPQQLNTYSYSRDNPINYIDPEGKQIVIPEGYLTPDVNTSLTPIQQSLDYLSQSMVPIYGDMQDVSELKTNADYFTGEELKGKEKWATRFGAALPIISSRLLRQLSSLLDGSLGKIARLFKKTDWTPVGKYSPEYTKRLQSLYDQFSKNNIDIGEHALNNITEKGLATDDVIDTFRTGNKYFDLEYGNINIIKDNMRISIDNDSGKIINVLDINETSSRFKKID